MKKLVTVLLSIFMTFCLFTFTTLIVVKDMASSKTLTKILNNITQDETEDLINEILDEADKNSDVNESIKYLDNEEFSEAFTEYIVDGLKFASGNSSNTPDSSKLEDCVIEAAKKYEKETGNEVDIQGIRDSFDELDKSFDEVEDKLIKDEATKKALNIAYGTAYMVPLVIIIVCLVIIGLVNADIKPCLTAIGVPLIINGVFTGLIGGIINVALNLEKALSGIGSVISGVLYKYAIIYFVLGVVLLIIKSILKHSQKQQIVVEEAKEETPKKEVEKITTLENQEEKETKTKKAKSKE